MATAEERIESRQTQEVSGVTTTTRVYQADTTPDLMGTMVGLPQIDDPLPWAPGPPARPQLCFSRTAMYQPGSVRHSLIYILYSDAPGTWGGINPAQPNFKSWSLSYFDTEVTIPYSFRNPIGYRFPGVNGQVQVVDSFDVQGTSVWESRKKFIRRLRVQVFNQAEWDAIGTRTNQLHKIYGLWYRFSIGDIQEVAASLWDVSYTWDFDPGTPNVPVPDDNSVRWPRNFNSTLYTLGSPSYTRPPFNSIYVTPGFDPGPPPVPSWPSFRVKLDHATNPTGWQGLPGMTL